MLCLAQSNQDQWRQFLDNSKLLNTIVNTLNITDEQIKEIMHLADIHDEDIINNLLIDCDNTSFEEFLNGFIVFKRGKEDDKPNSDKKAPLPIKIRKNINNVVFKKIKIAYALTNEQVVELFDNAGVNMTKSELTTFLRKEGHKHYRYMDTYFLNVFLDSLSHL